MPRQPGLWKRQQDGYWYTTIRGKKVRLTRDKAEARKALYELLARPDAPAGSPVTRRLAFRRIADQFLGHCERTMSARTLKTRLSYLKGFCAHVGGRAVSDLRVEHVTAWESKNPHWKPSTVATVRSILTACLNWATNQGVIEANPLARLKPGGYARRDRILTADERTRIMAAVTPQLRDFLEALELTGGLPFSEVAGLTTAMIDWQSGTIPVHAHKNAKRGKTRTIYLSPRLEALLRRKCEEHPTGLLFRTKRRRKWTAAFLCMWMRKLEKDLSLQRLTTYAWRHSAVTTALKKGLTAEVVAELVGNSAATVSKHYSHLEQKKNSLKAAASFQADTLQSGVSRS
jgi:integrase